MQRGGGDILISPSAHTATPTPPPLITPTLDPTPTQEVAVFACAAYPGGVNVRSGHSTLDPVIGILRVNDCARWIATEQGWYYVEWGRGVGWVAGWLMRLQ